MKTISLAFAFFCALSAATTVFGQCSGYAVPNSGKPIKVEIYSEEGECFKLSVDNQIMNPDQANSVIFYESAGFKKVEIVLASGEIIKKNMGLGEHFASCFYKIDKNKKGEYALKICPFKGEMTQAGQDKQQQDLAKLRAEQEKSSNEWHDKIAADKAKREQEDTEAKAKKDAEAKALAEKQLAENEARTNKSTNAPSENTTTTATIEAKVTQQGYPYYFQFLYKRSPIANKLVTMRMDNKEKTLIAVGTTSKEGIVTLYTDLPMGEYDVEMFFGDNAKESISGNIKFGNTSNMALVTDFEEYVKELAKLMNVSPSSLATKYGLD